MHRTLLSRRGIGLAVACTLFAPLLSHAQGPAPAYPTKPVTVMVGFPAGGPTDTTSRILGEWLSRKWGQPVIVENRPGANGTVAAALVAKAPPDGYTLLMATRSITMNGALYTRLPYDPAKAFVPVAVAVEQANILAVRKSFPAHTVAELLQTLRAKPDAYSYASTGNGSIPQLSAELFQSLTGTKMRHIPYKGGASLIVDLVQGRVDMSFASLGTVLGQIKEGQVVPIAVASEQRNPLIPDVPTFAEAGVKDFDVDTWHGLLAPAGTPPEIVARLNADVNEALASPDVQRKLTQGGSSIHPVTPVAFRRRYDRDVVTYSALIHKLGLQLD